MKVALVSLNQVWEDKNSNRLKVSNCLQTIISRSIDLVIFPEMTLTGFTMHVEDHAECPETSETVRFFRDSACKYGVYIGFGVILKAGLKAANHFIIVSPEGKMCADYIKIHPFSYAGEDQFYEKGKHLTSLEIQGVPIGLSICYDLRFPEMFQALSRTDKLILNIANWPERRVLHWKTLIQARAIENQVYFLGVNRTGKDGNGLEYQKSSLVVSPEGEILRPDSINEEIDIYEIDPALVEVCWENFPVKNDRQVNFYKEII